MFRGRGGGSGLTHKYFIEIPVSPTILCGGTDKALPSCLRVKNLLEGLRHFFFTLIIPSSDLRTVSICRKISRLIKNGKV